MKIWIALLRGINVGGKHIVPMKELRTLLEKNGFTDVKTYIQSGNVVLQSPTKPKDEIGELIEQTFGFKPSVFVLSVDDFKKAVANNPYQTDQGKTVHFFFLKEEPETVSENKLSYEAQKELNKKIRKLEKRIADCEQKIEKLETEIGEVEADMATPEGASDMALYEKHQKLKKDLDQTVEERETVSMELEEMQGS